MSKRSEVIQGYRLRVENLTRYTNIQRLEHEEDNVQKEREAAAFREKQVERENTLARELNNIKREEMNELLLRQQLRENSPELRDLERKLQAAYIRKDLSAQIMQKEAEKLSEKEEEYQKTLKQEDIYKKAHYRQELQDQMILKDQSKRYLYEEFLKEKKMIDDIVQRIHDEDEREIAERMIKMMKTREEMMAFKAAQEMWKKRKQEEIEEENRKIQEFLMSKAGDLKMRLEAKERKEAIKAQISENIAKQIYAERVVINVYMSVLLGRHCPNASSNIGCLNTDCL
ncbi:hypothetical protein NQ314_016843 [Rhamnusium bicolor]|uniref:Meiosis-specific nuclear structural protein 1 n=1 Tax=Rhamnusium bicolor TaxID=1586634 RepID=A0AAV8WW71_9CUCU|nr:hypothetical protein NQ314_016843 [Rhamnusium bicolor]